jgi:TonB family protein
MQPNSPQPLRCPDLQEKAFRKVLSVAISTIIATDLSALAQCRAGSLLSDEETAPYRSNAVKRVLAALHQIPRYTRATIRISFNGLGQVTDCIIMQSTGNKGNDEKLLKAARTVKLLPMQFATGVDDSLTLLIPLSHKPPSPNSLYTDDGEAFIFASPSSSISHNAELLHPAKLIAQGPYTADQAKYDQEVAALYKDKAPKIIQFTRKGSHETKSKTDSSEPSEGKAEVALKKGQLLRAVNEYLLASANYHFAGKFDQAMHLFEKSMELSSRLTPQEKKCLFVSLTNYGEALTFNLDQNSKDANYVAQKAKELGDSVLQEQDTEWIGLLLLQGKMYENQPQSAEAAEAYSKAIKLMITQARAARRDIEQVYGKLARVYELSSNKEALQAMQDSHLAWLRTAVPDKSLELIPAICELALAKVKANANASITENLEEITGIINAYEPASGRTTTIQEYESACTASMLKLADGLTSLEETTARDKVSELNNEAERIFKNSYLFALKTTSERHNSFDKLERLSKFLESHGKAREAVALYEVAIQNLPERNLQNPDWARFGHGLPQLKRHLIEALRVAGEKEKADRIEESMRTDEQEKKDRAFQLLEEQVKSAHCENHGEPDYFLNPRLRFVVALLERNGGSAQGKALFKRCLNDFEKLDKSLSELYRHEVLHCARVLANHSNESKDCEIVFRAIQLIDKNTSISKSGQYFVPYDSIAGLSQSKLFLNREKEFKLFLQTLLKNRLKLAPDWYRGRADLLKSLSVLDTELGDFEGAETGYRQLLALGDNGSQLDAPARATQLIQLAEACVRNHNYKQANEYKAQAIELAKRQKASAEREINISHQLRSLAYVYVGEGQTGEASQALCDALSVEPASRGNAASRVRAADDFLDKCVETGNYKDGYTYLTFAIAHATNDAGADSEPVYEYRFELAELYLNEALRHSVGQQKAERLKLSEDTFNSAAQSFQKKNTSLGWLLTNAVRKRILTFSLHDMSREADELQKTYLLKTSEP